VPGRRRELAKLGISTVLGGAPKPAAGGGAAPSA
jgi:hypothetical protein